MRLKNKKTGEIVDHIWWDSEIEHLCVNGEHMKFYNSLAELNAEWEDYEEPEMFYWIDYDGKICKAEIGTMDRTKIKEIGNYFDSREEAEKAVEKLKALTKLCKKGFEFNSVEMFGMGLIRIEASIPINEKTTLQERSNITDSLYLLFGGEE